MKMIKLNFSRFEGKSLPQVLFKNPAWFFWAYFKGIFQGELGEEATEIYQRATSIAVPGGPELQIEYMINEDIGEFLGMRLVIRVTTKPEKAIRRNIIDLSIPYRYAPFDLQGYHTFIREFKDIVFGNPSIPMSKGRCERFFIEHWRFELEPDDI